MKLELCGGHLCPPDAVNLDPVHGQNEWRRLAQSAPWPCEPETFDSIMASHVMEHIPAGQDRINVMNEAWRVIKPGGVFTIIVPLMPSWQALADPTHVSFWCPQSLEYFTGRLSAQADYGIKYWDAEAMIVEDEWLGTWKGTKRS